MRRASAGEAVPPAAAGPDLDVDAASSPRSRARPAPLRLQPAPTPRDQLALPLCREPAAHDAPTSRADREVSLPRQLDLFVERRRRQRVERRVLEPHRGHDALRLRLRLRHRRIDPTDLEHVSVVVAAFRRRVSQRDLEPAAGCSVLVHRLVSDPASRRRCGHFHGCATLACSVISSRSPSQVRPLCGHLSAGAVLREVHHEFGSVLR